MADTAAIFDEATRVLPGGSFGNVDRSIIIREGKGGRVWDVDGREYIDYLIGSGPMILGHGHPAVTAAVAEQLTRGTTFFANNEYGIRLAAAIVDALACAEKVRFVSTGSEATFYAMRIARAHAKRDKVLKFEGGFHGMSDYALMSMAPANPGNFPQAQPDTPGIPQVLRGEVLIAPYNDPETAVSIIKEYAHELGAVIVEPQQRLIPAKPGFLEALREATEQTDIPLIFDEVVTGFRHAYGGGQEYYGVTPDICALGKIIGGGFPLAAIAGRAELMNHFDSGAVRPEDFVRMTGTLSGNPVAAVAGLATLEELKKPGTYDALHKTGRALMDGFRDQFAKAGIPAQIVGEPPMFDVIFTEQPVVDYRSSLSGDAGLLRQFNRGMRERGILKGDAKIYVSCAHDERDVRETLEASADVIEGLKKSA
jgi:glutamate-1-semialdehyde 2,1-aminomutase